jgi:hypothetical protein
VKWPRVGPREERWPTWRLGVEGEDLLVPHDERIPIADVVQVEVSCGVKGALAKFVRSEGEDLLLIVSSWRRLRTALESLGFVAFARRSYPDRLLFVPRGAEPHWERLLS